MILYRESNLNLAFSQDMWAVRKYDGHTYYQGLSGAGLKGVDFLALQEKQRLILIELKNFRSWPNTKIPAVEVLVDELTQKVEDSLVGVDAIKQMLERKPGYLISKPILQWLPAQHYSWSFWNQAGRLMLDSDHCTALICLVGLPDTAIQKVQELLLKRLKRLTSRVIVTEADTQPLPGLRIRTL